ncbi:MAG: mannan-binding lectin [Rhizobiales bacterium]|nr:mannan-binding lectin [Hyphomicrobiales bacterium]
MRVVALFLATLLITALPAHADWEKAGPIWNNIDAQRKCPQTCSPGKWDGNWKTTDPGKMSVCSCMGKPKNPKSAQETQSRVKPQKVAAGKKSKGGVRAGSIWTDMMAEDRCPKVCGPREWDGRWSYVDINNSICYCR